MYKSWRADCTSLLASLLAKDSESHFDDFDIILGKVQIILGKAILENSDQQKAVQDISGSRARDKITQH